VTETDCTLAGRVALVTGASRGLGKAVAATLARHGAHLALAARDGDALHRVVEELAPGRGETNRQVVAVPTDVSRPSEVEQMVECAVQLTGRLDVLVCNAGVYGPLGPLEELDWDAWAHAIEINLFGTVLSCRSAVPYMRRQGYGKIITLSGGGATRPLPRFSAYAASKTAVVRFTETLAEELRGTGIDVNSVAPGALNTRLLDDVLAAGPDRVGEEFFARARRQQQDGGTPLEHGAELIAFLASSASDGISGRLLSAVWDDWRALPDQRQRLERSDVYTLRRIIPSDRGWAT
jgi:NAD(P)-dependent dehydrogenase (short-subunit alcohol dehydrogenase family)